MATSQSLASIMEQMVTKVMEDAVSTSIIYTQAQYDESAKEKAFTTEHLPSVAEADDPSGSSFQDDALNQQTYVCSEAAISVAPPHQTRRRLFHVPPMMQQATTVEQTRLEKEVQNPMILEEQDNLSEAKVVGAFTPLATPVELLLEELLLTVVGTKMADDASSDFFSQDSPLQHFPPCSQDFAFFKAIEQTREDLTTEEEDESQELSPPSQLVYSPSTSHLGDLMGLASQEDFFSSSEDAPALKRQRTLTTHEVEDIRMKVLVNEQPANDDVGVEVTEGNRSMDDEEEAMPLTFHTKEDLLRKLQGLHHLRRGDHQSLESTRMTGFDGVGNKRLMMVERSSEGRRRQKRTVVREQEEAQEIREGEVVKKEQLCKMKEEVEFGAGGSKKVKIIAKEGGEQTLRQDSFEDNSTMESKSKPEDSEKEGGVKSHQPLLLHRAPRLGLSRLQKPSGIHDISIIKDVSFNEGSDSDVSFIKEE